MTASVEGNAKDLLPGERDKPFTSGEVLDFEFKLIHDKKAWDPKGLRSDPARAARMTEAKAKERLPWRPSLPPNATARERDHDAKLREADEQEAERLALYAWSVDNLPNQGQAALCLSGGGIRSAAFALGILQGLARRGLLEQFHYLSTVSGGGYIASWLTAWRHRVGAAAVTESLKDRKFGARTEPAPMQRLRFNQNFLTPKVGLASVDTWTAVGAVLRNLLLNWLVFLSLLAGLLLLPRIVEALLVWVNHYSVPSVDVYAYDDIPSSALYYYDVYPSLKALFYTYLWLPHATGEPMLTIHQLGGLAGWRSWFDTAAVALVVLGFAFSAYHRPVAGAASITQRKFVARVVVPVAAGAVMLTVAISSWLERLHGSGMEWARWAYLGAIVYLVARLTAALFAYRRWGHVPAEHRRAFLWELLGWAVAGICTGLLIGVGAELCHWYFSRSTKYLAVFGPPWIIFSFLLGEAVYVGVTSGLPYGERDREWLARAAGCFGIVAAPYLLFSWLVLFGWEFAQQAGGKFQLAIGGSGLLAILGALTPLTRPVAASVSRSLLPMTGIVTALSALFVLGASAALAEASLDFLAEIAEYLHIHMDLGSQDQFNQAFLHHDRDQLFPPGTQLIFTVVTCVSLLGLSAVASFFVNVNFFSLHAMYRNRLVKTFLGASNAEEVTQQSEDRDKFDGYSEKDNVRMAELYKPMNMGEVKLYPILNMSLNLLATQNLAWQERKAEPFVCTPFFTGGDRVGYRHSALYAAGRRGDLDRPELGISLGTAMAISGAAVSPNWGYHSSPITSFLMMLSNVRLGAWLGNPQYHKHSKYNAAWRYSGPRLSWRLFVQEALGWTDDEEPWIYLSDGGHFENLGLYEMIRRRCKTIVVSDAGADAKCTLEDLGNAVRKISVDLGVRIDFRRINIRKRSNVAAVGVYCALGDIYYPGDACGKIIYFKPGFYGAEEPADVRAYAAANAKFPHESTLRQWFSESQFESYRSLGAYVVREICKQQSRPERIALSDLPTLVENHLKEFEANHVNDGATLIEIRRRKIAAPSWREHVGA